VNDQQLGRLILYIVDKVSEQGGYTTTIRLVKFLYLIDLEHQRRLGRPLTSLPWVFYHHGPYAAEIAQAAQRVGFVLEQEEFRNQRGYKGRLLTTPYHQGFPAGLGPTAENVVNGILSVWADQDTTDLLAYVYRTEPMRCAKRYDPLDLSVVPIGTRYYELYVPISRGKARKLRNFATSYPPCAPEEYVQPATDDDNPVLAQGLEELLRDEEDLADTGDFELMATPEELRAVFGPDED